MNWLQKTSSITFSLEGSFKISQPKTVLDLSYDLLQFANQTNPNVTIHQITSDGDDFDKMEGIINWYVTDKVPEDQQKQIIQEWIQEMQLMGYQMQVSGPDVSGLNRMGDNSLMVYRIHVLQNGSQDYMQIPEMNLANSNAKSLMESLGIPFDWSGSISLYELQSKLESFNPWQQQELLKEPEHGGGEGTGEAQWFEGGRTESQIDRYIEGLKEIINFGLQNDFTTLVWG